MNFSHDIQFGWHPRKNLHPEISLYVSLQMSMLILYLNVIMLVYHFKRCNSKYLKMHCLFITLIIKNFSLSQIGVTFPSADMQKRLISEVYDECKLDPLKVSYVEAHGTGTPAGDPIEMSAISEIFCEGRSEPLLVGTVKSNMGHSEPTSGKFLC